MGSSSSRFIDSVNGNSREAQKSEKSKDSTVNYREVKREPKTAPGPKTVRCPKTEDLVFDRRGSMYQDEHGGWAHEFFEVVRGDDGKTVMRQITENLTPQGRVSYDVPRLKHTYPKVVEDL